MMHATNSPLSDKPVFFAVLNWGIGHATRSVPIIHEFIAQGFQVTIASDGDAGIYLKNTFPSLKYQALPGYGITYPTQSMMWNMLRALPKILHAIRKEKKIVAQWSKSNPEGLIISDNRYGCFYKKLHSIFITHQLYLVLPNKFFKKIVNYFHTQWILQFSQCWIPDLPNAIQLLDGTFSSVSGLQSMNISVKNIQWIGIQSQLENLDLAVKYDLLFLCSGPEPQRSKWLKQLLTEARKYPQYQIVIVGGNMNQNSLDLLPKNCIYFSHCYSQQLSQLISASNFIIARSGYSSIMDILLLGKRALLVPTPGQYEQEYLAKRMKSLGVFDITSQDQFAISKCNLDNTSDFNYSILKDQFALKDLINSLKLNTFGQ